MAVKEKKNQACILVVDDEIAITAILTDVLEGENFDVISFNDSRQALEALQKSPTHFDFLLTDQTMPYLSGLDLSKAAKALNPELPIVICTGFAQHINKDSVKKAGILDLLYKPLNMEKLITMLHENIPQH
ncbi:MAG: response regulator [Gammaproteobacteria bacterium]|nr:response regulator [Gammaproteobacteria bacterium]MDH5729453.1 response regulator [Gammaproteobacteria bacterium]